jgi:uncharacterized Zn finger protein
MTRLPPANPPPSSLPPERRFGDRRLDTPRRVKNGLKLSNRNGVTARNAIAERWLAALSSQVTPEAMGRGLEYAQAGQIVTLQAMAGEVEAHVQGTAPRPYVTRLTFPALDERQWQGLIDAMAGEAIHVARLLGGEMPPGIDEVFVERGAWLVPAASAVANSCTCAAGSNCKHIAAAAHMLADQLSEQALLVFTLLGLPAERLLERLRQARTLHTHGVAMAHGETTMPGAHAPAPPLESQIEDFWRGSGEIDAVNWQPPATAVRHAILRRLGPSPVAGKFPMVGLLASIYDSVAEAARQRGEEPEV